MAGNKIHLSVSNQAMRHKLLGHTAQGHCCLGLKHLHYTALVMYVRGCRHWAWVFNQKLSSMAPIWQWAHFWAQPTRVFTQVFRSRWANVTVGKAGARRSSTWAIEIYGQNKTKYKKTTQGGGKAINFNTNYTYYSPLIKQA